MVDIYKTNKLVGKIEKIEKIEKGCWINMVKPTESEIKKVAETVNVDEQVLRYPLDIAEKAHIDINDESVLIVVDSPVTENLEKEKLYTTIPLGIIHIRDDIFITISQAKINAVEILLRNNQKNIVHTDKKSKAVFQILFQIAQDYIRYLTYINKDIEKFEAKMQSTMSNDELMKLLNFQKTMTYFNASVKANQGVLERLHRGTIIKLYEEDEEILEDTIIENRQAIEMIATYSEILNGIIDIFGMVVSNNLNNVMKILTSVTLIISIPTMISSFLGMNVDFPFTTNVLGFFGIIGVSIIATIICTLILIRKKLL